MANLKAKNGAFSQLLPCKNQFLFYESSLFYQSMQYPEKYPPFTLGSMSNYENLLFFSQTPYNFDLP